MTPLQAGGMRWSGLPLLLTIQIALLAQPGPVPRRIGHIEFFGYQGLDLPAVRKALPFREGDIARPKLRDEALSAVEHSTGRKATDVFIACCTGRGELTIFIGLPGVSSRPLTFSPAPQGAATLPAELTGLYRKMFQAEEVATLRSLAVEDRPLGYRLLKEPAARAAELSFRAYALGHEPEIIRVLTASGDAGQRAMAADALGFSARNSQRISALVGAVRDPDEVVRNNATRALFEILRGDAAEASQIPPGSFIEMLRSDTWTDRNKGSMVLVSLTRSRNPALLRRIQSEAGGALVEMAGWREFGRSLPARLMLARIDGKPDSGAFLELVPGSVWGSAGLAVLISGLLAFLFGRFPSKLANAAVVLLASAVVSLIPYRVAVGVARSMDVPDGLALAFVLACYLVAAAAAATVIFARRRNAAA